MIDFHSHVLPHIDDGSRSLEMSVEMLRETAQQGVSRLVLTPHFYPDRESPEDFLIRRDRAVATLLSAGDSLPPEVTLHLGCEISYYHGISHMEALEACCIVGTSTLLLEMPFSPWGNRMYGEIMEIRRRGITPVLAHVERYFLIQNKKNMLASLSELGSYNQVSADYFLSGGWKGMGAMGLFDSGNVHLLGSDCHNLTTRPQTMGRGYQNLVRKFGEAEMTEWMECGNRLLQGAKSITSFSNSGI